MSRILYRYSGHAQGVSISVLYYERKAQKQGYSVVIGIDEAGRGPLAGPVVVAAVYLKTFRFKATIDDSKKLSPRSREEAFGEIAGKSVYGVGVVNEGAIDDIRITRALSVGVDVAAGKVLAGIKKPRSTFKNTIFLCDGTLSCGLGYPFKEIIGGDGKSISIAAASIVAKVVRDRMMVVYDRIWPQYGFRIHKGYGTKEHMRSIARFGLCPIHRRTFCEHLSVRAVGYLDA
ncbi:MAG: ribonuclease HII [Candidatus Omnitrophica bacterium]|nr:ribonuclease HII [Candidatus Omnitrophota bacterium]